MSMTLRYCTWILLPLLSSCSATNWLALHTHATEPAFVLVDHTNRYATTYVGVPKDLTPEKLQKIKENIKGRKGAYLEPWESFRANLGQHVTSMIIRNDYPEIDISRGLVALLERYNGTPFGVTWNGGLAVTNNDYQYAEQIYGAYLKDPASVKRPDRRADRLHPNNHLQPLLQ
jgi:hypothetical protein